MGAIDNVKEQTFKTFFTYLAYQWREAIYKQAIRFNVKTNPHPLVKYRTNCPLARSMIFKNIYNFCYFSQRIKFIYFTHYFIHCI